MYYMCVTCVCVRNERLCQFSKFTFQKGTSYQRSIFSVLQRTLQNNHERSRANRYETRMIIKIILYVSVKRMIYNRRRLSRQIRVKQMLIISHMHRVK